VNNLGENRVQEMLGKIPEVPGAAWHLIGHLQTNKVKAVIGKAALIHSVDSARLGREISKHAAANPADILMEINIAGEDSKHGVPPEGALALARELAGLPGVRLRGLMTVAPFDANPENNRIYFRKMRETLVDISSKLGYDCFNELSMGMTGDYQIAVEEGATMVRIGTGLFGGRG
jgi:pyridoxal phosphate enzyme (YggS family)